MKDALAWGVSAQSQPDAASPQLLLEALPYGCVLLEPLPAGGEAKDFVWRLINRAAEALGLGPAAAWLGQPLSATGPAPLLETLLALWRQNPAEGEALRLEQLVTHAAEQTGIWYGGKLTRCGELALLVFEDVTPYKQLEAHIQRMAFQDELTGIYNRRFFLARASGLLALARRQRWPVALVYLDLNGFKAINDRFGHRRGDLVLQAVAGRLRGASRESDILFRSSGDEFALFLSAAGEEEALGVAARVAEQLAPELAIAGERHRVGASIGVAVMTSAEATLDDLLDRADAAMYRAKAHKELERFPTVLWQPGW